MPTRSPNKFWDTLGAILKDFLNGARSYKLNLPKDVPAK